MNVREPSLTTIGETANTDVTGLLIDHLDLWTGAVTHKRSSGRGGNGKVELTGIKKLRELILELAVRGKLVEQDPDDEPASVLLERIAEEKARLVKEGKIKKPKKLPEVALYDLPAPLPMGWGKITLSHLGVFCGGKTPSKSKSEFWNGDIPWVTPKDMKFTEITDTEDHVTEVATDSGGLELLPQGVVLFVVRSGILRRMFPTAITHTQCTINQDLKALQLFKPEMARYIQIMSWGYEGYILQHLTKTGTTVESLKFNEFALQPFPLPPLDEQQRIVEKVDELMTLCDRLEQQVGDQLEAHEVLVDTLLDALTRSADAAELAENWARIAEHFDTLFTTEASIDKLKQTILQLAVMGRLVLQDPNDEPAEDLLSRLAADRQHWLERNKGEDPECATMLRKLKKLSSPLPPFSLPKGWAAAHLIQLSRILVDCHNKTAPYIDDGIPIIRTSNIREREFTLEDLKYVSEETYQYWSRRCLPEPKDIIFTREAPMGEAAIIPEGAKWCLGQRTMLIRPMLDHINEEYLLLTLTEPHLLERASEKAIGSTVKHLRVGDVEKLTIPLPPLAEQLRIVEKVNELMVLCDQLKARLGEVAKTRTHLAEAVVEQAVS